MDFTIHSADCINSPINCQYPYQHNIGDAESLKAAVCHDYVCAFYENYYRSNNGFIGSDCLPVDCDNEHSEDPDEWVTPDDVRAAFPGVAFAVHYSRNHLKEKNGKKARPKFHILFPIEYICDADVYKEIKIKVNNIFPFFDRQALDAARFFFGTSDPKVELYEGTRNLTDYLEDRDTPDLDDNPFDIGVIHEGSRNSTMSQFAGKILTKYGATEKAYDAFLEKAEGCEPPLSEQELNTIWRSALKFFKNTVETSKDYVPPEVYNDSRSYKPEDYSDVGQAEMLAKHFSDELRYSEATHFICYRENYWQETQPGAQAVAQELTRRQMREANRNELESLKKLENCGQSRITKLSKYKMESELSNTTDANTRDAINEFIEAKAYKNYALKRRDSRAISAALKEAQPMLLISPRDLDADGFVLCTPGATYDLRKGLNGAREHSSDDFLTKITTVSPGTKGEQLWTDCLNLIFCGDRELIDYVQMVCGLAAIGKVYLEAIIIAYGSGKNGKSTFWNSISRVLGLYSGNISADTLTVGCRRNIKPELAETRGKRLLIAAEMQEGARLNDSTVKQLCSTDDIYAEKKYKDPFSFTPSHTLVLYTNHLPRVSAQDDGIWRRLIVIPFNAKIEGSNDIKNYGDYLYANAGESILAWIIEGAEKIIKRDYKLPTPEVVQKAIDDYRAQNDWFNNFIEDCCIVGNDYRESSQQLYNVYREYAERTGTYKRGTADFYTALNQAGYSLFTIDRKKYYKGLKLKDPDYDDFSEIESEDDYAWLN